MNTNRFMNVLNGQIVSPLINFLILLFSLLDIAAIIVLIYSLRRSMKYRPNFDLGIEKAKQLLSVREKVVLERWNSVVGKMAINSSEAAKLAIIEADNLTNDALEELGIEGADLPEKLSNLELDELEHDEDVFAAHQLKKELTDTPGFVVSVEDGKKAVAGYEAFLKELGLLGEPPGAEQAH